MKTSLFSSKTAKYLFVNAVFGLLFFASILTVSAQTTTFAQFLEQNGTQDFVFTNNSSSAAFNTVGGGSPIAFRYQNISGLPAALTGFQDAHMFVSTTTTQAGALNGGNVNQPFNQTVTVQIFRDTPTPIGVGSGSRTNLLTAVFSPNVNAPSISGSNGGNSATLSATTPDHVVTFTSDFISFGLTTDRNLGLSFSSVTPSLALGVGSFLQSFTAAGTGTFASNPPPVYVPPTAAGSVISGQVFAAPGVGLRGAKVILTESNGNSYKTVTGSFGQYSFPEIASGQTVVVTVVSQRYTFQSQVITVQENISDMNFMANE
ncbi:MAG TPA: carboxypeptidase regulatory-like domain-containing protein [Pyrinomonadaceae bacterium]|nr:carboxypeptidase regulatory-like domain-containing protein [Pyrinomonadaceae bacterium]